MEIEFDLFDPKSIDAAIKRVRELQTKVEAFPEKAVAIAARKAQDIVAQNVIGIPNYDGNAPGDVFIKREGPGEARVGMEGEQVAFLEYGTGIVGQESGVPEGLPIPVGWAYNTGEHIHNNRWVYNDERHGGWPTMTSGIPAYAPVYRAMQEVEEQIPSIIEEALK